MRRALGWATTRQAPPRWLFLTLMATAVANLADNYGPATAAVVGAAMVAGFAQPTRPS